MAKSRTTECCPKCGELQAKLDRLEAEVAELKAKLAKAKKNSRNSSKPPSSDIVDPPPTRKEPGQRKRGAQPGHPKHKRPAFEEAEIDFFYEYSYDVCPDCGGSVDLTDEPPRTQQQVDFVPMPIEVSEHRGMACWCPQCQKMHYAPIPDDIRRAGLAGPRLTALVAYLKGVCHCSFSTIRKFLRDVVKVRISRGQLRKLCAKVGQSLDEAYQQLLQLLPGQDVLNVDETGHKDNGQRLWTWCFRASLFTLFKIDPSRGSQVLMDVLGKEFQGILGCDYFSAYRKYMRECSVPLQFCLAHFIRDVKFLVGHPVSRNRAYGRRVREKVRALFAVIHHREEMDPAQFAGELEDAGEELWAEAVWRVPPTSEAQNLANRFRKHGESYIRFITTPGIEPTNNLAEQAIRFVVIDRHVTQGSRSEAGQRWLERIWTTIATCTQQGRPIFEFLHKSVISFFRGQSGPSLVPDTS